MHGKSLCASCVLFWLWFGKPNGKQNIAAICVPHCLPRSTNFLTIVRPRCRLPYLCSGRSATTRSIPPPGYSSFKWCMQHLPNTWVDLDVYAAHMIYGSINFKLFYFAIHMNRYHLDHAILGNILPFPSTALRAQHTQEWQPIFGQRAANRARINLFAAHFSVIFSLASSAPPGWSTNSRALLWTKYVTIERMLIQNLVHAEMSLTTTTTSVSWALWRDWCSFTLAWNCWWICIYISVYNHFDSHCCAAFPLQISQVIVRISKFYARAMRHRPPTLHSMNYYSLSVCC